MAFASILSYFDFKLIETKKIDHNKVEFVFDYSIEIQKCMKDYWAGELQVEPKSYFYGLKAIKGMIIYTLNEDNYNQFGGGGEIEN